MYMIHQTPGRWYLLEESGIAGYGVAIAARNMNTFHEESVPSGPWEIGDRSHFPTEEATELPDEVARIFLEEIKRDNPDYEER
jgi:hypothetical protein